MWSNTQAHNATHSSANSAVFYLKIQVSADFLNDGTMHKMLYWLTNTKWTKFKEQKVCISPLLLRDDIRYFYIANQIYTYILRILRKTIFSIIQWFMQTILQVDP